MSRNTEQGLKKSLSPLSVWAIAFGCIIGWGSFINPGKKFLPNSGVAGTAIAMGLGALVMIIIAFSYSYMVPKYPKAGGEFTYTEKCFGKIPAFICGWFLVVAYLTNVPMNSTAIPLIVDGLDGSADILKFGFNYEIAGNSVWLGEILLAVFFLLLFGVLNILGVKKAGFVQTILALGLIISVFALFIAALCSGKASWDNVAPIWGFDKAAAQKQGFYTDDLANQSFMSAILATFAIAPWAFVGFDAIPQASEEFKFSPKKVIFIMIIAILFGCFVYVSNNTIAAAAVEGWADDIAGNKSSWLLLEGAKNMMGTGGAVLVGVAVSCAVLSGMMGFYLAASRLMYSMSKQGYLPKVFAKVDKKKGTPVNAILFCMIVSLAGPILGREALGWFVDMSAIGASIGYLATCAATIYTIYKLKERKKPLIVLASVGCLFSLAFIVLQLIPIPGLDGVHFCWQSYVMLAVWVFCGIIFFIVQRKKIQQDTEEPETN